MDISYSDGRTVKDVVIAIWEDLGCEAPGCFRAFWVAEPEGTTGSPVIGYCSAGGSHRTVRATAAEVSRMYPGIPIYRNGKPVSGV